MPKVVQITATSGSKDSDGLLYLLDEDGQVFVAEHPTRATIKWQKMKLPPELDQA